MLMRIICNILVVNYCIVPTCHRKAGCETKGNLLPFRDRETSTKEKQWSVTVCKPPIPTHLGKR